MATYTLTAASIIPADNLGKVYIAGEDLTAGDFVYQKASDKKVYKAQCDGTAEESTVVGMAMSSSYEGQPVSVVDSGRINVGSALSSAGKSFHLSPTAGKMCDAADYPGVSQYYTLIGGSDSLSILHLQIYNSGIVKGA